MSYARAALFSLLAILVAFLPSSYAGAPPFKATVTFAATGETADAELRLQISQANIGIRNTVCGALLLVAGGRFFSRMMLETPAYQISVAWLFLATSGYLMLRALPTIPLEIKIPGRKAIYLSNDDADIARLTRNVVRTGAVDDSNDSGKKNLVVVDRVELTLCNSARLNRFFLCDAYAILRGGRRFDLVSGQVFEEL